MPALIYTVSSPGYTSVNIRETETGRQICSAVLRDGDQAVLCWKNSLFDLDVTEIFVARGGVLVLDTIVFNDPRGLAPPVVAPVDVDDLYHTGGPFTASGIGKPFRQVSHRVSEAGNPTITFGDRTVVFKEEVGFGGGVIVSAASPSLIEILQSYFPR